MTKVLIVLVQLSPIHLKAKTFLVLTCRLLLIDHNVMLNDDADDAKLNDDADDIKLNDVKLNDDADDVKLNDVRHDICINPNHH